MTVLYIDVSHHDWLRHGGNLDWGAVREATSPVMVARATYGDPSGWYRDSRYFYEFQTSARLAGFTLRGGYHNLVRGDTASMVRQVDWLRRRLDIAGCQWAMCDVEPYVELVSAGVWPRWQDVKRFHDRWYQVDDRPLTWYIPRWFWDAGRNGPNLGSPDLRQLRGPLIQSHYAGGDGAAEAIYAQAGGDDGTGWDDRFGGRLPDIWQYTNTADVPGASSETGVNAYRGTLAELATLLTGETIMLKDEQLTLPVETLLTGERLPATGDLETVDAATAVAFALRHAFGARRAAEEGLKGIWWLKGAATAEETRDAGTVAAIEALAELVRGGGGSPDTAAILARIDARAAEVRADVEGRHQEEMAELTAVHADVLRDRDAQIAALTAELEHLKTNPV